MAILPNLAQENEALKAKLAQMEAALAAKTKAKAITMKVTAKKEDGTGTDGALSVYGLGRWPVTLYRSQWERLFKAKTEIEAFIAANADLLAVKVD